LLSAVCYFSQRRSSAGRAHRTCLTGRTSRCLKHSSSSSVRAPCVAWLADS
jgi:hypothetical protein